MNFDTLIAASMNNPQRNVSGAIGPRCRPCSGLGRVVPYAERQPFRRPVLCTPCDGHGIDLARVERRIERMGHEALWQQINALESRAGIPITSRHRFPRIDDSMQSWMEAIWVSNIDGTAISASTTETILFPNVTIPANYMEGKRALRMHVKGKFGTHSSGTVTHVIKVRYGGVSGTPILATTGTVTLVISLTNAYFEMLVDIVTRSNGPAGTLLADGHYIAYGGTAPTIGSATGAPAVAPITSGGQTGPAASSAADLTADWALAVTLTHGANQAANTATGMHYTLESMN